MKAKGIAGGLLLALYLLWLTATAPARLLVPMLPPGVQVGSLSGSVWRGAAQPVYWHGERLERLAWSLTLAGWQVSLSDPRGVEGQARLHSPVGSLELAQVNGTFRCTADGAVALTLRQDSHQLSLSGQGTLSPDGRYLFRGTLQPRQGMPPLLALLVTRPASKNEPGRTPWQIQGKWLPQEQK